MYAVQIVPSARASVLRALVAPDGDIIATTDQGWSKRQLLEHASALNAARMSG
jgi:hypothetical protein